MNATPTRLVALVDPGITTRARRFLLRASEDPKRIRLSIDFSTSVEDELARLGPGDLTTMVEVYKALLQLELAFELADVMDRATGRRRMRFRRFIGTVPVLVMLGGLFGNPFATAPRDQAEKIALAIAAGEGTHLVENMIEKLVENSERAVGPGRQDEGFHYDDGPVDSDGRLWDSYDSEERIEAVEARLINWDRACLYRWLLEYWCAGDAVIRAASASTLEADFRLLEIERCLHITPSRRTKVMEERARNTRASFSDLKAWLGLYVNAGRQRVA